MRFWGSKMRATAESVPLEIAHIRSPLTLAARSGPASRCSIWKAKPTRVRWAAAS